MNMIMYQVTFWSMMSLILILAALGVWIEIHTKRKILKVLPPMQEVEKQLTILRDGLRKEHQTAIQINEVLTDLVKKYEEQEQAPNPNLKEYLYKEIEVLEDRIQARQGNNFHDESKKTLILEERLGVHEEIKQAFVDR